jgi:hypothetical protein
VNVIGALITGFEVGAPALPATSATVDATLNKICADRMAGKKNEARSPRRISGAGLFSPRRCVEMSVHNYGRVAEIFSTFRTSRVK